MSGKYALIIGNTDYIDPGLAQLTAPGRDAEDFARVLKDQNLCDFDDVRILLDQMSASVIEVIDEFFDQRKPDDMLVLYFSGHGVRDALGSLYLAFRNTIRTRLRSTAIKADYIKEAMDQSRSKRQVLILDCCNSGAFPQGTKAEVGGVMGLTQAFQGYGRFVLTASDATQFAWEGNKIIGETDNSLFTHFLVKGLEGEADKDGDGKITVDELYDYTFEEVSKVTPKQTPTKSASKVEGEIVLRQFTRLEDIKPVRLPEDLISEIEDLRPYVREAAVQKLGKIIRGRNIGMARSAKEALEKIITDDNTTRRVAQLATQELESARQSRSMANEERRANEQREHRAASETEQRSADETKTLAQPGVKQDVEAQTDLKQWPTGQESEAERDGKRETIEQSDRQPARGGSIVRTTGVIEVGARHEQGRPESFGIKFWLQWLGIFAIGAVVFYGIGNLGVWDTEFENTWFLTLGLFGGILGTLQFLFLRQYGFRSGVRWIALNALVLAIMGGFLIISSWAALLLPVWALLVFFGLPFFLRNRELRKG